MLSMDAIAQAGDIAQRGPEAEAIAGQHAEQRVNERIKSNSTEGLAKQNQGYQDKLIKPLARWVLSRSGGSGCVREFCDGVWEAQRA